MLHWTEYGEIHSDLGSLLQFTRVVAGSSHPEFRAQRAFAQPHQFRGGKMHSDPEFPRDFHAAVDQQIRAL
jgi:hypothetical protein